MTDDNVVPPICSENVARLAHSLVEHLRTVTSDGEGSDGLLALFYAAASLIVGNAETIEEAREFREYFEASFGVVFTIAAGSKFPGTAEAVAKAAFGVAAAMREDGIGPADKVNKP